MANKDELKRLTHEYWGTRLSDTNWYIENLLPREMDYAQQQQQQQEQLLECDTLALLVGFSPDPLLQTIWTYSPERIVLILNNRYQDAIGRDMADEYYEWIEMLITAGKCPASALPKRDIKDAKRDIAISPNEAKPDWIFCELRDRLLPDQRAGKRIIVDITGAKKNMAAGAFLFAAYAGIDINYVDFDEYDEQRRRPYGYSCRIGPQPNPYSSFGLGDWKRVQQLFENYAFRGAEREVEKLEQRMSEDIIAPAFTDAQRKAVAQLREVLNILDDWDNGDFTAAWKKWSVNKNGQPSLASQLTELSLPQAITVLGAKNWPSTGVSDANDLLAQHRNLKRGTNKPEDSIFNQPDLLLTYAFDEQAKINRLIRKKGDFRSALLRSAGLDELLLKAQVAILWLTDYILIGGQMKSDAFRTLSEQSCFNGVADYSSADNLRNFLLNINTKNPGNPASLQVKYWNNTGQRNFRITRRDGISVPVMNNYWNKSNLDHEVMVRLRGEAIHTHLSIPRSIAEAAYRIATFALEDFETNWVGLLGQPASSYQTWLLSWDNICEACNLDFLPALSKGQIL
jgi:hypothetical protein